MARHLNRRVICVSGFGAAGARYQVVRQLSDRNWSLGVLIWRPGLFTSSWNIERRLNHCISSSGDSPSKAFGGVEYGGLKEPGHSRDCVSAFGRDCVKSIFGGLVTRKMSTRNKFLGKHQEKYWPSLQLSGESDAG